MPGYDDIPLQAFEPLPVEASAIVAQMILDRFEAWELGVGDAKDAASRLFIWPAGVMLPAIFSAPVLDGASVYPETAQLALPPGAEVGPAAAGSMLALSIVSELIVTALLTIAASTHSRSALVPKFSPLMAGVSLVLS